MIDSVATLPHAGVDGSLVIIRADGAIIEDLPAGMTTLLDAVPVWRALEECVAAASAVRQFTDVQAARRAVLAAGPKAVLPRTHQALYGSAYGNRATRVFGSERIEESSTHPLLYQGSSDRFLGTDEKFILAGGDLELDYEPEIGVIVDYVPQGTPAEKAEQYIRLVTVCNDFTYRRLVREERKSGFGFINGKPLSSLAPLAVPPARLGNAWNDGRLDLVVRVARNHIEQSASRTVCMEYSFHELIAKAARTRPLQAGTIVFSGTINDPEDTASTNTIVEMRAREEARNGAPTSFLQQGDLVSISLWSAQDENVFGFLQNSIF